MPSSKLISSSAAATYCAFLILLLLETRTATAYRPADGPGQVCRPLRLDETAWELPAPLFFSGKGGELPAVPLVEDQDIWPRGGGGAVVSEGATLRLEAWVPATGGTAGGGGGRCVPEALTLAAGHDHLRIPLPPPPAMGWRPDQWNAVEAPVWSLGHVAWAGLDQLAVSYACASGEGEAQAAAIKVSNQTITAERRTSKPYA